MARFDVHVNPISADCSEFPYVLEIQSDLLYRFTERVCVPLARPGAFPGMTARFNPVITVFDEPLHLHPLGIAVFHLRELGKPTASAQPRASDIDTALDMLLRGY